MITKHLGKVQEVFRDLTVGLLRESAHENGCGACFVGEIQGTIADDVCVVHTRRSTCDVILFEGMDILSKFLSKISIASREHPAFAPSPRNCRQTASVKPTTHIVVNTRYARKSLVMRFVFLGCLAGLGPCGDLPECFPLIGSGIHQVHRRSLSWR